MVYRLIDAALIRFFMIPFQKGIEILVKEDQMVLLVVKGLRVCCSVLLSEISSVLFWTV